MADEVCKELTNAWHDRRVGRLSRWNLKSDAVDEYQVIESSTGFYDKYVRKSELQHQTHYCPGAGTAWCTS